MYCGKCGSFISDGQSFCGKCGAQVLVSTPQTITDPSLDQPIQPFIQNQVNSQPAFQQTGYQQTINQMSVDQQPKSKALSVAGMVIGIVSIVLFWIPYFNVLIAITGAVLSIVGIVKKNSAKIGAIVGLCCALFGFLLGVFFNNVFSKAYKTTTESINNTTIMVSQASGENTVGETTTSETASKTTSETTIKETGIDKDTFIASCTELNYKELARNPDKYVGQNFKFVCYVSSARTGGLFTGYQRYFITYAFDLDKAQKRIDEGRSADLSDAKDYCKDYDVCVWLLDNRKDSDPGYIKVLEKDVIVVYGTFNGLTTSKNSLTGETSEEVSLDVKYVEIIAD